MEVQTIKEGDSESIKNYIVDYLIKSGFVVALTKKTIFPSDIHDYLDDFISEVWLAILEQKPSVWIKIYNTAKENGTDIEYEARNYFSRVILNTCRSTSSNAYRKLKKPSVREKTQEMTKWDILAQQLTEPKSILEQIAELNNR